MEALPTTDWNKSSNLREHKQLHRPQQLHLLAPNKSGLVRSLSLSLFCGFVIIPENIPRKGHFYLTFFLFYIFKGLCLAIWFEGNSICKLEGR